MGMVRVGWCLLVAQFEGYRNKPETVKTLFIAPQVPWPLTVGSKIRVYNLLKCYANMGEVTLVCLVENEAEAQEYQQIKQCCQQRHYFPLHVTNTVLGRHSGKLQALFDALCLQPKAVRYFNSDRLSAKTALLMAREKFDIIHVERLFMVKNVHAVLQQSRSELEHPLFVLDIDEFESEKMIHSAALDRWYSLKKYLHFLEFLKLKAYERRLLRRFDCILVCSERDRLQLQRSHSLPWVEIFSNGAEVGDCLMPTKGRDDGRTLVYFGAMNYQPNEDAVLYFVENILPLIRNRFPDIRFVVAGKSPSARLRALHNGHDLLVIGYVEDKQQLFGSCTAFIVPLRIGGGTRLKILEAMSFGKPVVSTSIGCEGIDVTPGENIKVADSPLNFATACVELLADETLRQELGNGGRELVLRRYQWHEIRKSYIKVLESRMNELGSEKSQRSRLSLAVRESDRK